MPGVQFLKKHPHVSFIFDLIIHLSEKINPFQFCFHQPVSKKYRQQKAKIEDEVEEDLSDDFDSPEKNVDSDTDGDVDPNWTPMTQGEVNRASRITRNTRRRKTDLFKQPSVDEVKVFYL